MNVSYLNVAFIENRDVTTDSLSVERCVLQELFAEAPVANNRLYLNIKKEFLKKANSFETIFINVPNIETVQVIRFSRYRKRIHAENNEFYEIQEVH